MTPTFEAPQSEMDSLSDTEKNFNEFFSRKQGGIHYSGLYLPSSFDQDDGPYALRCREAINSFCANFLDRQEFKKPFSVHTNFVNHHIVNAYAAYDRANCSHYIGITAGAYLKLDLVFSVILACVPVCERIAPLKSPITPRGLLHNINSLDLIESSNLMIYPVEPERQLLSIICSKLALEYMVLHEIGHLANGHANRLCSTTGLDCALGENGGIHDSELSPDERIAMEIFADQSATDWHLWGHDNKCTPIFFNECPYPYQPDFDAEGFLYLYSFVTGVVLHLFKGSGECLNFLSDHGISYPHPEVRFNTMYSTIINATGVDGRDMNDEKTEAIARGIADCVSAVSVILGGKPFANCFSPTNKGHDVLEVQKKVYRKSSEYLSVWKDYSYFR